mmetsp:Transcript_64313/g.104051  ORF Transcript_64313/g.104051 Transcript_64313/m.104051 type:complete len:184 (-) Transcript_64313:75-626(-)|eukprot:CAMPEP_0179448612 /NCGR_PEP_ID=MMETSP0799-20121207/32458_1 /TAXON_ID=46947 /ORGANISM="Geminigera cryophila, Strain CCMP2564" /LENGTH=183 /DNA_ID=CAMNT_0021240629 /DNA_START=216 /DNA_END=767 /DNA_ORIENTATION=-
MERATVAGSKRGGKWRERASAAYWALESLSETAFDMDDLDFVDVSDDENGQVAPCAQQHSRCRKARLQQHECTIHSAWTESEKKQQHARASWTCDMDLSFDRQALCSNPGPLVDPFASLSIATASSGMRTTILDPQISVEREGGSGVLGGGGNDIKLRQHRLLSQDSFKCVVDALWHFANDSG